MNNWGRDGWAVPPGEGQKIKLAGPHVPEVLVRGSDVDQALGAFIFTHDVIRENPPHAHHGFMKIAFILDAEYEFRVGDATFIGGPGRRWSCPEAASTPSRPRPVADQPAELNERFRTTGLQMDAD